MAFLEELGLPYLPILSKKHRKLKNYGQVLLQIGEHSSKKILKIKK
jgi:hypothetical protein